MQEKRQKDFVSSTGDQSADIQINLGDIIWSRHFHLYIIIADISNIYSRIAIYHSADKVETVLVS